MKRFAIRTLALATICGAQGPLLAGSAPSLPADEPFSLLVGRWMRTQGPYVIAIAAIDQAGKIDASYSNPRTLPFERAEVTREGESMHLVFVLRAGGYGGSTYTLTYDPSTDSLKGVYKQVVVMQTFDVTFVRMK
jgi:hypothetical protein